MARRSATGEICLPSGENRIPRLSRRAVLAGLAASLSACVPSESIVFRHAQLLWGGGKGGRPISRDDVARIPAASIAVRMGSSREVLVLLDRVDGRDHFWLSTDRVMLVTRGGRLIQTAGFPNDLQHTSFPSGDPVDGRLLAMNAQMSVRLLDYEEFGTGLPATSKYRVVKKEPLSIIGSTIPTVRVSERVRMRSLKWHFTNTYWVHEETGVIWRSRQHFHPDHPALTMTTMRPARPPAT